MLVLQPFPDLADHLTDHLPDGLPDGLELAVWTGEGEPGRLDEVEVYVPPYMAGEEAYGVMARMPRLRVCQTLTAGVEQALAHLPEGALLCNARGVHDASTAELVVTLVLASLRGIPDFVRAQDRGEWAPRRHRSLADRTVLIVGYGSVGAAVERRLAGFEVDVLRVARRARDGVAPMEDLPELLPRADVVVLVVPMTEETRGLVDAAFLARMPDGALLVNAARGSVVDSGALLAELTSGRLLAALDVTDPEPLPGDSPLWRAPGLLVSPHVGGASSAFYPRAYALLADQLPRLARGEQPVNVVSGDY